MFNQFLRNPFSRPLEAEEVQGSGPDSGPHSILETSLDYQECPAGDSLESREEEVAPITLRPSVLSVTAQKMVNPQPEPQATPASAPVDQATTLQQILTALQGVQSSVERQRKDFNDFRSEEFTDVKNKLERNISALDQRQLALEAAQDRTEKTVVVVQQDVAKLQDGHAATSKSMTDFHERLKIVEKFVQDSQNQPSTKASVPEIKQTDWKAKDYKDFLSREMDLISGYEQETANYQNVVVVGPKPRREPVTPDVVSEWLEKEGVPRDAFQVFKRGKNGILAVVFYSIPSNNQSPTVTGPALAASFRESFPKLYSSLWAVTDQNRQLREGKKRARDFADAYKKKYGQTWWRINDNLLLVDEIVVAPVTLIPGKAHWGSLAAKITTARKSQTRKITFDTRLCSQVNLRTFAHCVKIYRAPSFLDDNDKSIFTEQVDDEEDLELGDDDENDIDMAAPGAVAPSRG